MTEDMTPLMIAHQIWRFGGHIAAFVCCTWAFWRGGVHERTAAGLIAAGWLLSALLTSRTGHGPGIYVVSIDVIILLAFFALAVWSRKLWTFFLAACMLNSVLSHFTEHLIHFERFSYVTAIGFWGGWATLICLATGVNGHIRQQKCQAATALPA